MVGGLSTAAHGEMKQGGSQSSGGGARALQPGAGIGGGRRAGKGTKCGGGATS